MRKLTNTDFTSLAIIRERCERLVDTIKVIQECGVMTESQLESLVLATHNVKNITTLALNNKPLLDSKESEMKYE